jgi:hypothetical protein
LIKSTDPTFYDRTFLYLCHQPPLRVQPTFTNFVLYDLYAIMGGSPSDHPARFANPRRKGRGSSFSMHRGHQQLNSNPNLLPVVVLGLRNEDDDDDTTNNSDNDSDTNPPPLLLLEMEAPYSDSESEEYVFSEEAASSPKVINVVPPHIAKCVSFTNVEIRSYTLTIGDHPCCTIGCPITLDWEYMTDDVTTVDQYETQRFLCRRNRNELRTTPEERTQLLLNQPKQSLSENEIRRASRKLHRARSCSARLNERMNETFFHCPLNDDE